MKRTLYFILVLGMVSISLPTVSEAVSISAVYDFRDQLDASTTSFEGLAFTDDGTLWITSSPNSIFLPKQLIGVDLGAETVTSANNYSSQGWFNPLNPVGLASDGENLFLTNNLKSAGGSVYSSDTAAHNTYLAALSTADCAEPEGAAYLNGDIYVSCQDTKNVVRLNSQTGMVEEVFASENALLGLGATDDGQLIIGDYTRHQLVLLDVASGSVTQEIDLAELFVDYTVVDPDGITRDVPDPDGLAYRNGKIYMTFEHDLQVYEIDLGAAVPEPGTFLLLGLGLLGMVAAMKKKSV